MANKNSAVRTRFDFSKIPQTIQIPNLIEVQKRSYDRFLQMDKLPSERDEAGLQSVFQSVFPITDFRNVSQLEVGIFQGLLQSIDRTSAFLYQAASIAGQFA